MYLKYLWHEVQTLRFQLEEKKLNNLVFALQKQQYAIIKERDTHLWKGFICPLSSNKSVFTLESMSRQDYKPHGLLEERWVCQIIVCQSGGRGLLFTRSRLNNMLKTAKACWENFRNCFIMARTESSRLNACSQALMWCYSFLSADTKWSLCAFNNLCKNNWVSFHFGHQLCESPLPLPHSICHIKTSIFFSVDMWLPQGHKTCINIFFLFGTMMQTWTGWATLREWATLGSSV